MPKLVYDFAEGGKDMKDLLGGKGANLAEMTVLGLPVPPGFTITTEACRVYLDSGDVPTELAAEVDEHLAALEQPMGKRLGDADDPLLVSVRSGAKFSMPGMMDTVLNIGLNDAASRASRSSRAASASPGTPTAGCCRCSARPCSASSGFEDVLDRVKSDKGVTVDLDLDADDLRGARRGVQGARPQHTGAQFPQDPREQMDLAVKAVFDSWNTERARIYRRQERIPADLGTAVNVCSMVFGNLGMDSGTGVAFTRDPGSGAQGVYGDYLQNAQGEDVVAGIRNTLPLDDLEGLDKASYDELMQTMARSSRTTATCATSSSRSSAASSGCCRPASASAPPAPPSASRPSWSTRGSSRGRGARPRHRRAASPGSCSRPSAPPTTRPKARRCSARAWAPRPAPPSARSCSTAGPRSRGPARGEDVVLVRRETTPDDLAGMIAAQGILTSRGGKTSHAAVVARGMGKTCVCGAEDLDVDLEARTLTAPDGTVVAEGDVVSIDGTSGVVFLGDVPVRPSPVVEYFEGDARPAGRRRPRAGRPPPDHATPTRPAGSASAPTPTTPRTPSAPAASGRRASACAAPSTCSSASAASSSRTSCWPRATQEQERRSRRCCRCSARTSSGSCGRWTACR